MTHIPEVLEAMEGVDNSTSKKNASAIRIPYIVAIIISGVFLLSLLSSTFLFFKYLTCYEEHGIDDADSTDAALRAFNELYNPRPKRYVRLPRSVSPESYKLRIVPYIWEGKSPARVRDLLNFHTCDLIIAKKFFR